MTSFPYFCFESETKILFFYLFLGFLVTMIIVCVMMQTCNDSVICFLLFICVHAWHLRNALILSKQVWYLVQLLTPLCLWISITCTDQKKAPAKENKHRAMDDIKESIMELKYYKANIFKAKSKNWWWKCMLLCIPLRRCHFYITSHNLTNFCEKGSWAFSKVHVIVVKMLSVISYLWRTWTCIVTLWLALPNYNLAQQSTIA